MAVVLLAALILAGTVIYTVSVMRAVQMQILTGELTAVTQTDPLLSLPPSAICRRLLSSIVG